MTQPSVRRHLALLALALAACGKSHADGELEDAIDALGRCDLRAARAHFGSAYDAEPDRPEAALGYGLAELGLLGEDPNVTALLADIGFMGPIDMQAMVYGPDGVLARAARHESCESISSYVEAGLPYPPLRNEMIDPATLIRPGLTIGDLVAHGHALAPKLERIARALEVAAGGMEEPVEIAGGCGLGTVTLQAPELLFAAALVEAARAALAYSRAYDWQIPVADLMRELTPDAEVALMNAHLLRVVDAAAGTAAQPIALRAIDLAARGLAAGKAIGATPTAALIDWTAVADPMWDDATRLVASVRGAVLGPTPIADVTPAITMDLSVVFRAPVDLPAHGAYYVVRDEPGFGPYVTTDDTVMERAFAPVFSPAPWDAMTLTWTPSDRWNMFDSARVTAPAGRYETIYMCFNPPPEMIIVDGGGP